MSISDGMGKDILDGRRKRRVHEVFGGDGCGIKRCKWGCGNGEKKTLITAEEEMKECHISLRALTKQEQRVGKVVREKVMTRRKLYEMLYKMFEDQEGHLWSRVFEQDCINMKADPVSSVLFTLVEEHGNNCNSCRDKLDFDCLGEKREDLAEKVEILEEKIKRLTEKLAKSESKDDITYQGLLSGVTKPQLLRSNQYTVKWGYRLVDLHVLRLALTTAQACGHSSLMVAEANDAIAQEDLATQLALLCSTCGAQTIFTTSSFSPESPANYSVNKTLLPALGPTAYFSLVSEVQRSENTMKININTKTAPNSRSVQQRAKLIMSLDKRHYPGLHQPLVISNITSDMKTYSDSKNISQEENMIPYSDSNAIRQEVNLIQISDSKTISQEENLIPLVTLADINNDVNENDDDQQMPTINSIFSSNLADDDNIQETEENDVTEVKEKGVEDTNTNSDKTENSEYVEPIKADNTLVEDIATDKDIMEIETSPPKSSSPLFANFNDDIIEESDTSKSNAELPEKSNSVSPTQDLKLPSKAQDITTRRDSGIGLKLKPMTDLKSLPNSQEMDSDSQSHTWNVAQGEPVKLIPPTSLPQTSKASVAPNTPIAGGHVTPVAPGTKIISSKVRQTSCSKSSLPAGVYKYTKHSGAQSVLIVKDDEEFAKSAMSGPVTLRSTPSTPTSQKSTPKKIISRLSRPETTSPSSTPKKGSTPIQLFSAEVTGAIKSALPALSYVEIQKIVVDRWNRMTEAEKQVYRNKVVRQGGSVEEPHGISLPNSSTYGMSRLSQEVIVVDPKGVSLTSPIDYPTQFSSSSSTYTRQLICPSTTPGKKTIFKKKVNVSERLGITLPGTTISPSKEIHKVDNRINSELLHTTPKIQGTFSTPINVPNTIISPRKTVSTRASPTKIFGTTISPVKLSGTKTLATDSSSTTIAPKRIPGTNLSEIQIVRKKPNISLRKSKSPTPEKKSPEPMFDDPNLPEGWQRTLIMRTSGASAGKYDVYIFTSDGTRLRCRQEVINFLKKNPSDVDPDSIDFTVIGRRMKRNKSSSWDKLDRLQSQLSISRVLYDNEGQKSPEKPMNHIGDDEDSNQSKKELEETAQLIETEVEIPDVPSENKNPSYTVDTVGVSDSGRDLYNNETSEVEEMNNTAVTSQVADDENNTTLGSQEVEDENNSPVTPQEDINKEVEEPIVKLSAVSFVEDNDIDLKKGGCDYDKSNKNNKDASDSNEDDEPRSEDEILIDEGGM